MQIYMLSMEIARRKMIPTPSPQTKTNPCSLPRPLPTKLSKNYLVLYCIFVTQNIRANRALVVVVNLKLLAKRLRAEATIWFIEYYWLVHLGL